MKSWLRPERKDRVSVEFTVNVRIFSPQKSVESVGSVYEKDWVSLKL